MTSTTLPQTVQEAVDQLAAYYSARDCNGLLSITSPAFIGLGSGPDENVFSAEELRTSLNRDFSQCDDIEMKFSKLHIREDIRAAWMLANCTITARTGGKVITMAGRMTGVFRRTTSGWMIAQTHFSMPYSGQEPGHSFPVTR